VARLTGQGKTERTARQYASAVRTAIKAVGGWDALSLATDEALEALWGYRWGEKKKRYKRLWWRAIEEFYEFLMAEGLRGYNPMKPVSAQMRQSLMGPMSGERFAQLRDRAAALLLKDTGIGPEALRRLTVGSYDFQGVLSWERRVRLGEGAAGALEEYLAQPRGNRLAPTRLREESPLFTDAGGTVMPEAYFRRVAREQLFGMEERQA
jgi:site-specific recombinase XerD